jgi:hypothetical protein
MAGARGYSKRCDLRVRAPFKYLGVGSVSGNPGGLGVINCYLELTLKSCAESPVDTHGAGP